MNTYEYYNGLFSKSTEYIEASMTQMLNASGISLTEVDPAMLEMWNGTVRYLNNVKEETLAWAKTQDQKAKERDELLKSIHRQNQILIGMLTKKQQED